MARRDGAAARQADRGPDGPVQGRELRARGRRTLGRLLDAGSTVFADRGFHAARVDDIVKAARTSHGTFYLYFTSKDDLFRALAEDVAAAMVALARELPPLTPDRDGYEALVVWLRRFPALYRRYGAMIERANYYVEARQIRVDRDDLVTTLAAATHAGLFGVAARSAKPPAATSVLRS